MTILVAEPFKRSKNPNRMRKPGPVLSMYQVGTMLQHLVDTHPEAIYFSDDPEADGFGPDVEDEEETTDDDLALLNKALNHAVGDGVITDSEADHLEQQFLAGQEARS